MFWFVGMLAHRLAVVSYEWRGGGRRGAGGVCGDRMRGGRRPTRRRVQVEVQQLGRDAGRRRRPLHLQR